MASKPGILTEWPWQRLGHFKYVVLAPWVVHSVYSFMTKEKGERDLSNLLIFPFMLVRMLHNQLWISWSRFQTGRGTHTIVRKSLEFEQVDRERSWDDQIIFNGTLFYLGNRYLSGASHICVWKTSGAILTILLHTGPVEFLYYWLHRALHHHFLYSRYHSHHHSSIVTEPITSVIHPFAEHVAYFILFSIPLLTMVFTRTISIAVVVAYILYIDLMNNMGHCNFELIPKRLFCVFRPLKYLMYTPSFHSLHHTQFRTNYSLFMPFYDYIYGTMDPSSDDLHKISLKGQEETPHVVHLTHPTSLQSIYHLRVGFASLASKPYASKWYILVMWPVTYMSALLTWLCGSTFTIERNSMKKLKMQTWAIPRFAFQYSLSWERDAISDLIEKAILEAEERDVKIVTLGLLNQGEELNRNGELYLHKHPKLKVRIVDGSSLAAAVVLNNIPRGRKQVLLRGKISKTAHAVVLALCRKGIQVTLAYKDEFEMLKSLLPTNLSSNLALSDSYTPEVWLMGDGSSYEEQRRAAKGTHFIPFSQFAPEKARKDCIYYSTPALETPKNFENLHSCENWLPRRAMSAWRVAGIVHALEGWDFHECGNTMLEVEKVWNAALGNGFLPLVHP